MNVTNTLKLNKWVQDNEELLRSPERDTLARLSAQVAKKLGFKVNAANLAAVMNECGISSRRPSRQETMEAKFKDIIEDLEAENRILRRTLAKVAAASHIPDEYKDYILGNLPAEIRNALGVSNLQCVI